MHKTNQDTLEWFKEQWLYGDEFLDYLAKENLNANKQQSNILNKIGDSKGLAQVAIDWFWDRHANYISIQ